MTNVNLGASTTQMVRVTHGDKELILGPYKSADIANGVRDAVNGLKDKGVKIDAKVQPLHYASANGIARPEGAVLKALLPAAELKKLAKPAKPAKTADEAPAETNGQQDAPAKDDAKDTPAQEVQA